MGTIAKSNRIFRRRSLVTLEEGKKIKEITSNDTRILGMSLVLLGLVVLLTFLLQPGTSVQKEMSKFVLFV